MKVPKGEGGGEGADKGTPKGAEKNKIAWGGKSARFDPYVFHKTEKKRQDLRGKKQQRGWPEETAEKKNKTPGTARRNRFPW